MTGAGREDLVVSRAGAVRLRDKRMEDALDDFQWRRDPETMRYDGSPPIDITFSQFLERMEYELRFGDPRRRSLAIELEDGVHIGSAMYYNATGRQAEFGISIGREEYRERGFGTAATVAFLRFVWSSLPFTVVYLHTLEWNERARRCFTRAGFEPVSRVERSGDWYLRMETRREWWLLWDMEGRFDHVLSTTGQYDMAAKRTSRRPRRALPSP
ncbi:MAG: GNAT family N-acetyltransferase [Dehalococcoidia bacterium]|nr:GNAT family N-acetyltransferase [Dehalococcoidia bacterium]